MKNLLFLAFILISCGKDLPNYEPLIPIKPFCGNGKSYKDLPKPILTALNKIITDKKNAGTSLNEYNFNGDTYFEIKIPVSSMSINGLYNCKGEDLFKKYIGDNKYNAEKTFTQEIWAWHP